MDYRERITVEPGERGGKPCIRDLRITVDDVLSYLAAGMTEAEILAEFPDLEAGDFRAVYAFAADRERRLLTDPAAQAARARVAWPNCSSMPTADHTAPHAMPIPIASRMLRSHSHMLASDPGGRKLL